jgi:hypothetical protein
MKTTDLFFMAFLIHKGHEVKKYDVISKGKISCEFDMSAEDWKKLKLEFNHSEASKLKQTIEQLKDLAY